MRSAFCCRTDDCRPDYLVGDGCGGRSRVFGVAGSAGGHHPSVYRLLTANISASLSARLTACCSKAKFWVDGEKFTNLFVTVRLL